MRYGAGLVEAFRGAVTERVTHPRTASSSTTVSVGSGAAAGPLMTEACPSRRSGSSSPLTSSFALLKLRVHFRDCHVPFAAYTLQPLCQAL